MRKSLSQHPSAQTRANSTAPSIKESRVEMPAITERPGNPSFDEIYRKILRNNAKTTADTFGEIVRAEWQTSASQFMNILAKNQIDSGLSLQEMQSRIEMLISSAKMKAFEVVERGSRHGVPPEINALIDAEVERRIAAKLNGDE